MGIGDVAGNVQGQLQGIGDLIVAICYLGGIYLSGFGFYGLKQASDLGREFAPSLWKMAVGAALISLPTVTGVANDTIFGDRNGSAAPEQTSLPLLTPKKTIPETLRDFDVQP